MNDGTVDSAPDTVDITVRQVNRVVTPLDLENLVFTFSDGVAFSQALADTEVTLSFEDFGGTLTGPFTLESAGNTATGTVTVASCSLSVQTSTFALASFPGLQPGSTVLLDPCELNTDDGSMRVQNANTGAISTVSGALSTVPSFTRS